MQRPPVPIGLLAIALTAATLAACATVGPFGVQAVAAASPVPNSSRVDVTVTNRGRKPAQRVAVRCSFFDGEGKPFEVGAAYFFDLAGGGAATESIAVRRDTIARSDCAVASKP